MLFIPQEIIDWYYEYHYAKDFGAAPYSDMPYMWVWAAFEYKHELDACIESVREAHSAKQNSMTAFRNARVRGNEDG